MSIGVFDSGVGGLTVYKSIASRFPKLDMFYFGDTARVPYGNKSPESIIRYAVECSTYLTERYHIEALVVACNTVSAYAIEILKSWIDIPVIGVIEPSARHAVSLSRSKRVAVIATNATINSNAYNQSIARLDSGIEVVGLACPLFVPLVEEALINGEMVESVVCESLKSLKDSGVDTIILGCTHYPLLAPVISLFMPDVKIVDSTTYILDDILGLDIHLEEEGIRKIFITDESHAFHSLKDLLVGDVEVEKISL